MKTIITIIAATAFLGSPAMATVATHAMHRHAVASDYDALSPSPSRDAPATDGCIGLSNGTSSASCGATLTGGPSGGLN